jgi:hypothetical protein
MNSNIKYGTNSVLGGDLGILAVNKEFNRKGH